MKKQYTPLAVTLDTREPTSLAALGALMAFAYVYMQDFYYPHPAITQSSQITRGSAFRK